MTFTNRSSTPAGYAPGTGTPPDYVATCDGCDGNCQAVVKLGDDRTQWRAEINAHAWTINPDNRTYCPGCSAIPGARIKTTPFAVYGPAFRRQLQSTLITAMVEAHAFDNPNAVDLSQHAGVVADEIVAFMRSKGWAN